MPGLRAIAPALMLLLLVACPRGDEGAADSSVSAPVIESPASAPVTPAAEAQADTAQLPTDEANEYAAIPLSGLTNKRLENAKIEGSWVGLFGQQDIGGVEQLSGDGHRVDFLPDGQAIWSRLQDGVVTGTMDSQWAQSAGRLELSFPADVAVQSGLAELAPLGMGAAETESPGGGSESGFNPMESSLEISLYPSFLVLTDRMGRMMIYGRLPQADPGVGAQGLAGDWTASFGEQPDGVVNISFVDGDMVLGNWNRGRFKGNHISGYFAGRLIQAGGKIAFAAAASNEHTGGHVHGIICEGPYSKVHFAFEFIR